MSIRILAALVLLTLSTAAPAATDIWVESSLTDVFPDTEPGARPRDSVRLYAARGEAESVQICFRGGRKGARIKAIETEALSDAIPAPEVYRVGYIEVPGPSPRAHETRALWPDPLLEFAPFDVPDGETRSVWLTYRVGAEADAGAYRGTITVVPERGAKRKIPVTVEVYDFSLPETPALQVYAPMDRGIVARTYGLPNRLLEPWKPIYDALAKHRLSFGLWTEGDLVAVAPDGSADTQTFKEHLEYAVEASHMAAINVGKGHDGIRPFPQPAEGVVQDPLQLYLHDIDNWLAEKGWLKRAFIQPLPVQEGRDWQTARQAYFRVWRADKRVHRYLAGALHPSLERYTDIWAVPLRYYQPFAQERILAGYSLQAKPAYPVAQVTASSSGGAGAYAFTDTQPGEACDGSLFTSWVSAEPPTAAKPQWIQIDLAEVIRTPRVRIGWKPGMEPREIRVKYSFDGRVYTPAEVRWDHHFAVDPLDQSWSDGRFRNDKPLRSLWLEFVGTTTGAPVGITEIEFDRPPAPETVERIDPLQIWTYSFEGDFPSLYADAHPAEPRVLAWACWGHRASGFALPHLARWPTAWQALASDPPLTWAGGEWGRDCVFYPGRAAPTPSVRVERLRDGIEDYDYLALLDAAVKDERIQDPGLEQWLAPRLFAADAPVDAIAKFSERVAGARAAIGAALSDAGEGE